MPLYQILLLLMILFITPCLAADFKDLPAQVKVQIFHHLKLPPESSSLFPVAALVPCLVVCRQWYKLVNSSVLWEVVYIKVNHEFHSFIRNPIRRIWATEHMKSFNLLLRTDFYA